MSRYLEFKTEPSKPDLMGNPIFSGDLPTRFLDVQGVRINGKETTFIDQDFVGRLHKALVDGTSLTDDTDQGFDCVAFALLVSGIDLVALSEGKGFTVDTKTDLDTDFSYDDTAQLAPVAIGAWPRMYDEPFYFHTVVPAHTNERACYIHKLGDEGPVCISGLRDAMNIVNGRRADIITSMRVNIGDVQVAQWNNVMGESGR